MSKSYISPIVRKEVTEWANHRCSYCQTQAELVGRALQLDHIIPEAQGGSSDTENLCLACSTCNQKKWMNTVAVDPLTGEEVTLFNPRQQIWHEHFQWDADGLYIAAVQRMPIINWALGHRVGFPVGEHPCGRPPRKATARVLPYKLVNPLKDEELQIKRNL